VVRDQLIPVIKPNKKKVRSEKIMDGPIPQTKQAIVDWCDVVSVRLINDNYRFNTCIVSPTLKAPAYD
jgi:hypothetical protein